ncbi:hypothetical protein ACQ4PT_037808 [Festuca glaucescens]
MSLHRGDTKPLPGGVVLHQQERTPSPPSPGKPPTSPPEDDHIRPWHSPRRPPRLASLSNAASLQQQKLPVYNTMRGTHNYDGEHTGRHGYQQQHQHLWHPQGRRADRSGCLRWTMAVVFTVLAILVLLGALSVLLVVLVLQPRAPYLAVMTARLDTLEYDQQGVLDDAQLSLGVVAANVNAHAAVTFSQLELRLSFNDTAIAILRADPFVVPPKGTLPLGYVAPSSAVPLDRPGRAAMEAALKRGVVPFRVNGQARTRFKVGGLVAVKYWTRLACEIRFAWPTGAALNFTCNSKARSRY